MFKTKHSMVQVEQGELVRYQVKADNSQVSEALVRIKDANGKPLYNMTTDEYGFTPWVTLPSNFHIDTDWNHTVTDPGEDSCGDGIDNDGDTHLPMAKTLIAKQEIERCLRIRLKQRNSEKEHQHMTLY